MWQISYPLQMVQVWVAIFVLKLDFSLKTLSKSGLNKPISPFFEEAHIVTDRQTDKFFVTIYRGMWIFSFS